MIVKNSKGLTIVELIIVIAIMAIVSTFAVIGVSRSLHVTRQKGDEVVLANINEATRMMMYHNSSTESTVFIGITSDEERLNELVSDGFLSEYPEPLVDGNSYVYNEDICMWTLNGDGGSVTYSETDTNLFTVSGTKITGYDESGGTVVVIPREIDGVTITEIGQDAFHSKGLTSVIIQDNITRISGNAFHSNNLTTVSIPGSVTRIWHNAFNGNNLTSVSFSEGLERIEAGAFSDNSITSVSFPSSLTFIGSGAFGYGGNFITSISIGSNVVVENSASLGWHGNQFKSLYDIAKEAGNYSYSEGWSKQ